MMIKLIKLIKEKKLMLDIINVILGIILIILCVLLFLIPITLLHIGTIAILAGAMNILNGLRQSTRENTSKSMIFMFIIFGVVLLIFGLFIIMIG